MYPDWLNIEAWEAWEIHRKEIKKRLTPSAIRLQWKLLQQYDKETQLEMIENSIRCSWTGLFPLGSSNGTKKLSASERVRISTEKQASDEREPKLIP